MQSSNSKYGSPHLATRHFTFTFIFKKMSTFLNFLKPFFHFHFKFFLTLFFISSKTFLFKTLPFQSFFCVCFQKHFSLFKTFFKNVSLLNRYFLFLDRNKTIWRVKKNSLEGKKIREKKKSIIIQMFFFSHLDFFVYIVVNGFCRNLTPK